MKKALYPGSFDPPTLGHLDMILRASKLFDKLYVGVGFNSAKHDPIFTLDERVVLLKTLTKKIKNVVVVSFEGLASELAKKLKVDVFIRSLRNSNDFDFEMSLSSMNRAEAHLETLFLPAEDCHRSVNSTMIRELAQYGGDITRFVPKEISKAVLEKVRHAHLCL